MNKLKNMFTEEIDDFEPIKKEMIQVEIPAPKKEENKQDDFLDKIGTKAEETKEIKETKEAKEPERIVQKREEKFAFPVFFDDDDFENIEKKEEKKIEKRVERKTEPYQGRKNAPYQGRTVELPKEKEKPKVFKPSPVISPIYGILDQNYKKEDIVTREESKSYYKAKEMSIDDIRKKAYGTLEDDLESNLLNTSIYDKPAVFRHEEDMFDDLSTFTSDDYFTDDFEVENKNKKVSDNLVAEEMEKEEKKEEPDLFGLIDSMYEKGDE